MQGILAGFHENVNKKIFIYSTPPVPPAFPPGFLRRFIGIEPDVRSDAHELQKNVFAQNKKYAFRMSFVESETISIAFPIFAVKGQKNLNKLFRKCPLFEYKKNVE